MHDIDNGKPPLKYGWSHFVHRPRGPGRVRAYAVMRCLSFRPSVCLSRSCILSKFFTSGSHTVLVFPYQKLWLYSDGDPLMKASNAGIGRQKSRFSTNTWLHRVNAATAECDTHSCAGPWQVVTLIAGKRRRQLFVGDDMIPWTLPYEIWYFKTRVPGLPGGEAASFSCVHTDSSKALKSLISHN